MKSILKFSICNSATVLSLILITGCSFTGNGSGNIWYSLEDAQEGIKGTDKKLLLAIHTEHCRDSQLLRDSVYLDDTVKEMLNKYFRSVWINVDSEDSVNFNGQIIAKNELPQVLGVSTFPAIVFLDNVGDKIVNATGFIEADVFAKILSYVGSDAYLMTEFDMFTEYN